MKIHALLSSSLIVLWVMILACQSYAATKKEKILAGDQVLTIEGKTKKLPPPRIVGAVVK